MTLIERLRLGGPNALEVTDEAADALQAQALEIIKLRAENEGLQKHIVDLNAILDAENDLWG